MSIEPLYTLEILRLAASLSPTTVLGSPDGEAERRSATCGSRVRSQVGLVDGRVGEFAQAVEACAFGQASAAIVAIEAPGKSLAELTALRARLGDWLVGEGEPGPFAPLVPARAKSGRHGAILLPLDALLAAFADAHARSDA